MENPDKEAGPTPVTPDGQRFADYEPAIGPNAAYYLPRFVEFDQGASRLGWNWPAFFATSPWFLYRKMWVPGLLNLIFPIIVCFLAGIGAAILAGPVKAHPVPFAAALLLLLAVPWFVLPMFANAIYWRHVRESIDKIPLLEQAPDKRAAHLARHGGTSVGVMAAGLAIALVPTLGVFAGIAIPAYQDYTIRAQITEGLNLAGAPKALVAEYYLQNEVWPEDSAAAGMETVSGKYVESVMVQNGSIVIVYGAAANTQIAGKTLILLPGLNESKDVLWVCGNVEHPQISRYAQGPYGTDIPNKYLPKACREEPRKPD